VTEIDAGHETPDATRLPGFFIPFFEVKIKRCKCHFSPCERGIELKSKDFRGRILTFLWGFCPFFDAFKC